jgi:hypothetical protein
LDRALIPDQEGRSSNPGRYNGKPFGSGLLHNANEGLVRIQYKWLVPINVLPEMKLCILVISKQIYNVLAPDFHIHVSVSDLFITRICLPILLQPNRQNDPGNISIAHGYMNVGIEHEAAQFHFLGTHNSDFRYSAVYTGILLKKF